LSADVDTAAGGEFAKWASGEIGRGDTWKARSGLEDLGDPALGGVLVLALCAAERGLVVNDAGELDFAPSQREVALEKILEAREQTIALQDKTLDAISETLRAVKQGLGIEEQRRELERQHREVLEGTLAQLRDECRRRPSEALTCGQVAAILGMLVKNNAPAGAEAPADVPRDPGSGALEPGPTTTEADGHG
jgi:hypothetical protein